MVANAAHLVVDYLGLEGPAVNGNSSAYEDTAEKSWPEIDAIKLDLRRPPPDNFNFLMPKPPLLPTTPEPDDPPIGAVSDESYEKQRQELADKLKSLCPKEGEIAVTGWRPKQYCDRRCCLLQAEAIANVMVSAVMDAAKTNTAKLKGWEQNKAFKVGEGMDPKDLGKGKGLKCEGWQTILEDSFLKATKNCQRDQVNCFSYQTQYRETIDAQGNIHNHTWGGILGPYSDPTKLNNADVELDPWQTGGESIFHPNKI